MLESDLSPKSVVRDMYESGRTFSEFVAFYGVARSEGLVLRYLSDTYRALRQTVPERLDDELDDIIEWLGETVRQIDSSLLDEWEALTDPESVARAAAAVAAGAPLAPPRPITANERAFSVMVRNAMFQRVQLAARDRFPDLGALEPDGTVAMSAARLGGGARRLLRRARDARRQPRGPLTGAADDPALGAAHLDRAPDHQRPDGHHDWAIVATVDLDASTPRASR